MKQLELADSLLKTAKELKIHFATATAFMQLKEYEQIFGQLYQIYFSLELPDTILLYKNALSEIREFTNEYKKAALRVLNHIITETIIYRGQYCIIRRTDPVPGLASHIMTNLGQIVAALNEGYIPVIDMQFAENMFTPLSCGGSVNAWELFFKQPFEGHNLVSATSAQICTLKDGIPEKMPYYNMEQLTNPLYMQLWKDAMKRYMPFSDTLAAEIKNAEQKFPFGKKRILGVLCRGTDYTSLRPRNHPVQPSAETMITKAKKIMGEYKCDYCYLATEDESILSAFRDAFREQLLVSQEMYFHKEQNIALSKILADEPTQLYEKNVEYLTSLYLLSRCNYFLAGRTGGAVVAAILNENPYEYAYFWNEGKYGIDDVTALQNLTIASVF